MTNGTAAAAAAQAQAEARSIFGALVKVSPENFLNVLSRSEAPLVAVAGPRFLDSGLKYVTAYKGLVFFTKSPAPLPLPPGAEVVAADKITMP